MYRIELSARCRAKKTTSVNVIESYGMVHTVRSPAKVPSTTMKGSPRPLIVVSAKRPAPTTGVGGDARRKTNAAVEFWNGTGTSSVRESASIVARHSGGAKPELA